MDEDSLKARSIELAERAYRQRDRAGDSDKQLTLDETADELILLENPDRFFVAQSKLENIKTWTDELRTLAHEINTADQHIRQSQMLTTDVALEIINEWATSYSTSPTPQVATLGARMQQSLQQLSQKQSQQDTKSALTFLLTILESMLKHEQDKDTSEIIKESIVYVRAIRDALLTMRALLVNAKELLIEDQQEEVHENSLDLVRDSLAEVYEQMESIRK